MYHCQRGCSCCPSRFGCVRASTEERKIRYRRGKLQLVMTHGPPPPPRRPRARAHSVERHARLAPLGQHSCAAVDRRRRRLGPLVSRGGASRRRGVRGREGGGVRGCGRCWTRGGLGARRGRGEDGGTAEGVAWDCEAGGREGGEEVRESAPGETRREREREEEDRRTALLEALVKVEHAQAHEDERREEHDEAQDAEDGQGGARRAVPVARRVVVDARNLVGEVGCERATRARRSGRQLEVERSESAMQERMSRLDAPMPAAWRKNEQ